LYFGVNNALLDMKFWKHSLITAITFIALCTTVLYTSCIKDSCESLKCRNEGTCADGFCRCPDGYEGAQCEIESREKFVGVYYGQLKIDQKQVVGDTAYVLLDETLKTGVSVSVSIHSRLPELLYGTVKGNDVSIMQEGNKDVTMKYIGENKIEILIDETIDGKRRYTNFSGTKKTY
jgi:hypothetical protein